MDLSSWLSPIKAPVFISTSTLISLHFQLKVVMCLSVSLQVESQNRSTNSTQFDIARLLILNRILGGKSKQQHVLERQQKGMVVSRKDKRLKKITSYYLQERSQPRCSMVATAGLCRCLPPGATAMWGRFVRSCCQSRRTAGVATTDDASTTQLSVRYC